MNEKKVGNYRWTICALLFFATTVNYLDRQVLSLLKPHLEEIFGWSNSDYANIASVFQFVYAISMLFAGRIIDKLGTKKGYAWAIIIWSVGAVIHAFAIPIGQSISTVLGFMGIGVASVSIVGFMVARAVLGFGEAGNFPAAIKATAEYFPKKERSFATGFFNGGTNIGAVLAPLSVPFIAAKWGWEAAFLFIGAIGFLWLIFWYKYYEKPEEQKRLSAEELAYIKADDVDTRVINSEGVAEETKVSWFKLLTYRQTWAFAVGKFMTDGVWWFFLFWLPAYLKDQYGMMDTQIMLPLAVLYSMTMVGSIGGGWFPMYFIKKGYEPYDGRMKAMLMIAVIPLVVLAAQPLGHISFWMPVLLIGVGASAHQAWSANLFTTVSDMFPKKAIGSVVGIGGMLGGLGGVVMTKLGGGLFDHYKALGHIETGYTIMFTICAVAYLVAWVIMKTLVPKYKVISDL
ncbi:MFS transporter [Pedobacter panaciterrae]|jgi:Sugar phosphate permease|uniref:MFS transporter n=1 Tax=Pedobacter panaciterrae TaxID=363849 RepID=A0ABU8NMM0_9SPHI|nr:MFS transporter [Pedobacter panaciterrae]NQX56349.1 MFS transporter [Pedobacter panaciterrae]